MIIDFFALILNYACVLVVILVTGDAVDLIVFYLFQSGETILHYASETGDVDVVDIFLSKGNADVNAVNKVCHSTTFSCYN